MSYLLVASLIKFQYQYYVECEGNNVLTACFTDQITLKCCGEFVGYP